MLSIIICTLNEELYLPKLLDSLAQQRAASKFEVLIIDGGSTDNTATVAREYKAFVTAYPIRFIAFNERGIARQRNHGATLARGHRLLFLDADVVLPKDFLQKAMRQIIDYDISIAGTKLYSAEKAWYFRAMYWAYSNTYLPMLRWFNPVIHGCSIFVTKKLHNFIGGFQEGILFEDFKYGSDAAAFFRPVLLKDTYVQTSARRFYHFSFQAVWELLRGALVSIFKSGIDPSKMKTYMHNTGNHPTPRY